MMNLEEIERRLTALEQHRIEAPAQVVAELHKSVFEAVDARPPAPQLYKIDPQFLQRFDQLESRVGQWLESGALELGKQLAEPVLQRLQSFEEKHPALSAKLEEIERSHPALLQTVARVKSDLVVAVEHTLNDFGAWVENRLRTSRGELGPLGESSPPPPTSLALPEEPAPVDVHSHEAELDKALDAELGAERPAPHERPARLVDDKAEFLEHVQRASPTEPSPPPEGLMAPTSAELEDALDAELGSPPESPSAT